MKDAEHPFFRPLWRRIALVAFCALWAAWELWNGQGFWGAMAGGMAAYGAWIFLLNYSPPAETGPAAPDETKPAEKE
jgi:hypothetical protein